MTKAQITKIINQLDNLESNMQFIKFILNDQTHGLNKRMFAIEQFIKDVVDDLESAKPKKKWYQF
tara:strand:- start:207 stop:401 length:195 start_codon:yes stop_codon:yes gene_type:complete